MKTLPYHHLFALGLLVLFHGAALSQSGTSESRLLRSLAKPMKPRRAKEVHAKVVVTDELMKEKSGTLPSIPLRWCRHSDAILSAIQQYRSKHTAQETESLVHDWFDQTIRTWRRHVGETGESNMDPPIQTYRTEGEYRMAMQKSAVRLPEKEGKRAFNARIQSMFKRIRNGLQKQVTICFGLRSAAAMETATY